MADHPLLLVAVGVVRRRPVKIVDRGDYVILLMCMMRIACMCENLYTYICTVKSM